MTRTNKENQVSAAVKPAAAPRCIWTSDDDVVLLQVLRQEKVNGGQSDSGWKSVVWTTALAELKVKGDNKGAPKTASKISDHFANLKANFVQVKKLREQSGFGWDDVTKLVIASNDTWDAYIKSHPNMAKWRRTPFPLYDDMLFLVDGIVATGEGAFHAGGDLASSEPGYSSPPTIPEDDEDDSSNDASPGGTGKTQPVIDEPGSIDDEDSQDTTPSRKTLAKGTSLKRAASTDALDDSSRKKKKGRRYQPNAIAVDNVASAVSRLADAFMAETKAGPADAASNSQTAAIELLKKDGDFSQDDRLDVVDVFTDHPRVVTAFLAIDTKEERTKFAQRQVLKHMSN